MRIKFITRILFLMLFLFSTEISAQYVYIRCNNSRAAKRVNKKIKFYVYDKDSLVELQKINDSTYLKPVLSDSVSLKREEMIKGVFKVKNICVELSFYNIIYGKHNFMDIRVSRYGYSFKYRQRLLQLSINQDNRSNAMIDAKNCSPAVFQKISK